MSEYGRYFEDFHIGAVFEHYPAKTILESDNNLFCLLTRNDHPIHSDFEYAAEYGNKKPLVVGTYIISLVVGMSVRDISGKSIALGYESITHLKPVFIGDTIYAQTLIRSKKESTNPKRGIVEIETQAYNQNGTYVLSLKRSILAPKKDA